MIVAMRALGKIVLAILAGGAGLMLLTGLGMKLALSRSAQQSVAATLQSRLPVPVSVGEGDFDLAAWFRFRPAITLQDLSIGNPPGFSADPMLEAEGVSAQVGLLSLFSKRIDIHSIVLRRPRLNLETDAAGKTNLAALFPSPSQESEVGNQQSGGGRWAIQSLLLEEGAVRYQQLRRDGEPPAVEQVNLRLTDFAPDATCKVRLEASPFGGDESRLRFDGSLGPFQPASLPAEGELLLDVVMAEIPRSYREQQFGNLLKEPGDGSRLTVEGRMAGDLMGVLRGKGTLTVREFQLGKDQQHRLPLDGELPMELTVRRALAKPSVELATSQGSARFGRGQWLGATRFRYHDGRFGGSVNGAIAEIDIDELLTAFTAAGGRVTGRAQIPTFELRFDGADAGEMLNSLAGQGRLTLEEGRITFLDLFNTVLQHANKMLGGQDAAAGETRFVRFASRFEIADRQVRLNELVLEQADSSLTGQGYSTFDQQLHFDVVTSFAGEVAARLGGKPDAGGQVRAAIPVQVRGTMDSPQVQPDLGRLITDQVTERVGGLLDSLFKKMQPPPQPKPDGQQP